MWDLIVSVPDHCFSFYFVLANTPTKLFIAKKRESGHIQNLYIFPFEAKLLEIEPEDTIRFFHILSSQMSDTGPVVIWFYIESCIFKFQEYLWAKALFPLHVLLD